jgi:hypothetical protein
VRAKRPYLRACICMHALVGEASSCRPLARVVLPPLFVFKIFNVHDAECKKFLT